MKAQTLDRLCRKELLTCAIRSVSDAVSSGKGQENARSGGHGKGLMKEDCIVGRILMIL